MVLATASTALPANYCEAEAEIEAKVGAKIEAVKAKECGLSTSTGAVPGAKRNTTTGATSIVISIRTLGR